MAAYQPQDPLFSKRAGVVMNSGYWLQRAPEYLNDSEFTAYMTRLYDKKESFRDAVNKARKYDDLNPKDRELFDEVETFDKHRKG